ncbi:UNVERIFIED_CONTAM: copper oxidase, partial [Bacteroidetes bacterium 56_B9]
AVPVSGFDPANNTICLPLGPGQMPVRETWELINLATENHNFHVHQTKFRFVGARDATNGGTAALWHRPGILEDNAPLPIAIPNTPDVASNQNGYCTM